MLEQNILGAVALISSPYGGRPGARYWFRDVEASGEKILVRPERTLGPIVGTLYTVSNGVLRMSAQLVPIGERESQTVRFQFRQPGGAWQDGPTATLELGYVALFRLESWDSTRDWEYRVLYPADGQTASSYQGLIRREPEDQEQLTVGLLSCTTASARSLEGGIGNPEVPEAELLGRYTRKNLYFPYEELVRNAGHHRADLLAFVGDQFYEDRPTRKDEDASPVLDYLYKWYLWMWAFRELTRNTPTILLVDDHDIFQGNLWGNAGSFAPERDENRGGYTNCGPWVNMVQRTQCGHNPDPYNSSPIDQGITCYYSAFSYGGVNFAIVEDRKFKRSPLYGDSLDTTDEGVLLGERQEKFLEEWAKRVKDSVVNVCFTQTAWACIQTSPNGRPLIDFDSNGFPKPARDKAIALVREAHALILAGDQHLASLVRHGLETFTDGVVQFSGPAAGALWQRWFEPSQDLPNSSGTDNTGDVVDGFGNKLRVLAIANPKISFGNYRRNVPGFDQVLGDRRLKSEGYGIIRINFKRQEYVIECWPWNVDPTNSAARQFSGWPYHLRFDAVDGRNLARIKNEK